MISLEERCENRKYNIRNKLSSVNEIFVKNQINYVQNIYENYYSYTINVPENIVGPVYFNVNSTGCPQGLENMSCDFLFSITGNNINQSLPPNNFHLNLKPGTYQIKGNINNTTIDNSDDFTVDIKFETDPTPNILKVGGLRIKEIIKKENNVVLLNKKFFYKKEDLLDTTNPIELECSGRLLNLPNMAYIYNYDDIKGAYNYIDDTFCYRDGVESLSKMKINSNIINNNIITSFLNNLVYTGVIEEENNYAKTSYIYDSFVHTNTPIGSHNLYTYVYSFNDVFNFTKVNLENISGNLVKKTMFNNKNIVYNKISEQTYEYDFIDTYSKVTGWSFIASDKWVICGTCANPYGYTYFRKYHLSRVYVSTIANRLKKETSDEYLSNGTVTNVKEYFYGSNPILPSKISFNNNSEEFKYPFDLVSGNPTLQCLINRNKIENAIEVIKYKNSQPISKRKLIYENNSFFNCLPINTQSAKSTNNYSIDLEIKKYDDFGNVLQFTKEAQNICYIYAYNHTMPVAKIENATYASIPSSTITNLQNLSNTGTEANLITALNALRVSLPNAMVTTYSHKPLIGISTITDPKGDTQTYHYDSFNRLQFVKDAQGNILSENQYHYRD